MIDRTPYDTLLEMVTVNECLKYNFDEIRFEPFQRVTFVSPNLVIDILLVLSELKGGTYPHLMPKTSYCKPERS